ncbi:MAG: SMP-30/gluconolactonase/LRE family protein [Armatimonadota bacterium]|nr:SMP-30/gluconolactonase/LRE family protein [Armatimonadota bacterium]
MDRTKTTQKFVTVRNLTVLTVAVIPIVLGGCGGGGGGPRIPPPLQVTVNTLAGSAEPGATDGPANVARFNNPVNVEVDAAGNVYVADFDNNRIRRVTPQGVVSTVVNQPNFRTPFGIAFTPNGQLYVQTDANDTGQNTNNSGTIWRINIAAGTATVVARNIGRPRGLTALPDGRLVLVDNQAHDVRLMNPDTAVITELAGARGQAGFADGVNGGARFNRPYGSTVLPNGNIVVADQNNHRIRLVTPAGVVTTVAGSGTAGRLDGHRLQAQFTRPQDVAADNLNNIYVSDHDNHLIRRIDANGIVTTIAGDGTAGFADGPGLQARFFGQEGLDVSADGSVLYVADGNNGDGGPFHRIRRIPLISPTL